MVFAGFFTELSCGGTFSKYFAGVAGYIGLSGFDGSPLSASAAVVSAGTELAVSCANSSVAVKYICTKTKDAAAQAAIADIRMSSRVTDIGASVRQRAYD